jgi:hypothetical protein
MTILQAKKKDCDDFLYCVNGQQVSYLFLVRIALTTTLPCNGVCFLTIEIDQQLASVRTQIKGTAGKPLFFPPFAQNSAAGML